MLKLLKYIIISTILMFSVQNLNAAELVSGTSDPPTNYTDVYPGDIYLSTVAKKVYAVFESGVSELAAAVSVVTDHTDLSNLEWTSSGHTGTASRIAGFDAVSGATEHEIGITEHDIVQIDLAGVADNDYAKFTTSGLEGRSYAEIRSDINVEDGADVTDATNVDAAGAVMESDFDANTILAATLDNTPVATLLNEQEVLARLTGGSISGVTLGISDNYIAQIDDADAADNDYAKFTANGLEGRSYAEVRSDLNVADGADVTGDNPPQAHKDSHDPNDGSDALDTEDPLEIATVQSGATGTAHSLARSDHAHAINHGITDNHIVTMDSADAADDEYARFTANGLESRSATEVRSDINVEDGADVTDATNVDAAGAVMESDYNAQTILQATADNTPAPTEINEQEVVGRLTGGNISGVTLGISDNYIAQIDDADAADDDYAKFTANGLEGRSYAEVRSDLNVADGADVTANNAPQAHAASHDVSAADTIFPADPNADRYLMWDDVPGQLVWAAGAGGGGDFADGGEAGGDNRQLGNTDAYSLGFMTSGATRIQIGSAGEVTFYQNVFFTNEKNILYYANNQYYNNHTSLLGDSETNAEIITVTVDTNAYGFGALLHMSSDGHYSETDANSGVSMPCHVMAAQAGTGVVYVIKRGWIRDTDWSWTPGEDLYVAEATGGVTNVAPIGAITQKIGHAVTSDIIYFNPSLVMSNDNKIISNVTLYCDDTGSDTEGDGTSSSPWFSPHRAMEYLADYLIASDATVTIQMNNGTYDLSGEGQCNLYHVNGTRIKIAGQSGSTNTELQFDGNNGFYLDNGIFGEIDKVTITGTHGTGYGVASFDFSFLSLGTDVVIEDFDVGLRVNQHSMIYARYVQIDNCDRGLQTNYHSSADVRYAKMSNMDEWGVYTTLFSMSYARDTNIDNCDTGGVFASEFSYVNCQDADIDHDGTGGDATYGLRSQQNSYIYANDATIDASGHITTDTSPTWVTDNDPTFGNYGSWIFGP